MRTLKERISSGQPESRSDFDGKRMERFSITDTRKGRKGGSRQCEPAL